MKAKQIPNKNTVIYLIVNNLLKIVNKGVFRQSDVTSNPPYIETLTSEANVSPYFRLILYFCKALCKADLRTVALLKRKHGRNPG